MATGSGERIEIATIGAQRPEVLAALEQRFTVHRVNEAADPLAALRALGPRIRGAASHGMAGISAEQLAALPRLEIVAIHGVGLETTDLPGCRTRGVVVATAPVLYDDVADLAIALALATCRRLPQGDRIIREGRWPVEQRPMGRKLTGMKAGIIGYGRIGQEVAARLQAFKCPIGYADPIERAVPHRRFTSSVELADWADILFLCAAGAARGKAPPIVGREVIEALGPRGIFVNVARGWLVDEAALLDALTGGRLGGAGLDVFDDEPNVPQGFWSLGNVALTPHVASNTEETTAAMGNCVVDNLVSWFDGKGALTPVP